MAMALCCIRMDAQEVLLADSISLPALNTYGQVGWGGIYPHAWSGLGRWDLHTGLNLSLGASVFAPIGKHHYGGAGFTQNVATMYAVPLSNRLSLAVGGYFSNISWGHGSYRDAGINAVLGYRFNEKWEAFVYAQKSLIDNKMPLPLYYMHDVGDRIGAAVRYSPNHTFSVTVSLEGRSEPNWLPAMPISSPHSDFPYGGMDW